MAEWRRANTAVFTGLTLGAAILAAAGTASADPTDPAVPPTPVIYPTDAPPPPPPMVSTNAMTPHQPPVPAAAPAPPAAPASAAPADPAAPAPAAPPPADPGAPPPVVAPMTHGSVPEIPNAHYGSGNGGGGIFSSIMDIWHQARNPDLSPSSLAAPAPPPGAGPAPKLPPGYVSTNAPGSETPASAPAGGSDSGRPALPPGYYPIDGPPPPWYLDGTNPPAPAPGS